LRDKDHDVDYQCHQCVEEGSLGVRRAGPRRWEERNAENPHDGPGHRRLTPVRRGKNAPEVERRQEEAGSRDSPEREGQAAGNPGTKARVEPRACSW
jgi:hypothetical protein